MEMEYSKIRFQCIGVNSLMVVLKAMESYNIKMDNHLKETFETIKNFMDFKSTLMEMSIKGILKEIKDQGKDSIVIIQEIFIKGTLRRGKRVEEKCIFRMEITMMECGKVD